MPDSAPPPSDPQSPRGDHSSGSSGPPSDGPHLATISFMGHFWDVYVEVVEDPGRSDRIQARLCFSSADTQWTEPVRTAPILIQPSYQEILHRARSFEEHQLVGLLRSCLPDEELGAEEADVPDSAAGAAESAAAVTSPDPGDSPESGA